MPEYSFVRVNSRGVIGATRCNIVVQAGESTRTVLDAVHCLTSKGLGGISIDAVAGQSDEETLELIGTLGQQSDTFALLAKNTDRFSDNRESGIYFERSEALSDRPTHGRRSMWRNQFCSH